MILFERLVRKTFIGAFILLLLLIIAWYFVPIYRTYIAGCVLGTAFSILNGVITAIKTVQVSEYALGQRKKRQGTGTFQRFLLAGFAGFVAVKFPTYFHYVGVIVGLTSVTALSLIFSVINYLKRDKNAAERGEK